MAETGIDTRVQTEFKDFYGNKLSDGLYFAGDGLDGDLYFVKLSYDRKIFSAESWEGFMIKKGSELFAKQLVPFVPLANPKSNLEFAVSKV